MKQYNHNMLGSIFWFTAPVWRCGQKARPGWKTEEEKVRGWEKLEARSLKPEASSLKIKETNKILNKKHAMNDLMTKDD